MRRQQSARQAGVGGVDEVVGLRATDFSGDSAIWVQPQRHPHHWAPGARQICEMRSCGLLVGL